MVPVGHGLEGVGGWRSGLRRVTLGWRLAPNRYNNGLCRHALDCHHTWPAGWELEE